MRSVIFCEIPTVAADLVQELVFKTSVKEIRILKAIEDLATLDEELGTDIIFIYIDGGTDNTSVLLSQILAEQTNLTAKIVIVTPLCSNLKSNHLLKNCLKYPFEAGALLDVYNRFV